VGNGPPAEHPHPALRAGPGNSTRIDGDVRLGRSAQSYSPRISRVMARTRRGANSSRVVARAPSCCAKDGALASSRLAPAILARPGHPE